MESIYQGENIVLPQTLEIPKMSDERLQVWYSHIKPVIEVKGEKYFLKDYKVEQLRKTSYIWDRNKDIRTKVDSSRLKEIKDFLCLHTFGYYGFFKPSIAEVLSQLPRELIGFVNTFEVVEQPDTIYDLRKYPEVNAAGFHLSRVMAYNYQTK